jgi:hypothetical protein
MHAPKASAVNNFHFVIRVSRNISNQYNPRYQPPAFKDTVARVASGESGMIADPLVTAARINQFLGGGLDVAKMAAAIDPALHRIRSGVRV